MTCEEMLEKATERHRAGDMPEARRLYGLVLGERPGDGVALFRMGLLEYVEKRLGAALGLIERAIAICPGEMKYQFGLGEVLGALGRWEEAAGAYRKVLGADGENVDARFSLGIVVQGMGDFAAAAEEYEVVVGARPGFAEGWNNLGICRHRMGELERAEEAYRKAIRLKAGYAGALSNLGTVLGSIGRKEEGVKMLRAAVELEPGGVGHVVNLGGALSAMGEFAEAERLLRAAAEAGDADAAFNLGNALQGLGRLAEAADWLRRANEIRPGFVDALINLGNVYREMGEYKLAMGAYERAMAAGPGGVEAMNNLGCCLRTLGRIEEAEGVLRRGLGVNGKHPALYNNLGNTLKDAGDLEGAMGCFRKAIELDPGDAGTHSNYLYSMSFGEERGEGILDEARQWDERHARAVRGERGVYGNERSLGKRLRIGYVSPDFREHCQSLFTIPLLSSHDHGAFEIFCYSSVEREDEITRRIRGYADQWREVRRIGDEKVCEMIRGDGIDVLVDLTMHMAGGRPLIFARRPAPVQVAWLAYPGTTGIGGMDYRFSDERLDPAGYEGGYSERTIRLANSFWCYDSLAEGMEVNELPAVSRGFVTFGCLNNPCKLTERTLGLWGRVMRRMAGARLLLMSPAGSYRGRLLARLEKHGVEAGRVDFVSYRPRAEYLRSYHGVDLGLDTFPYNGHTTSLDSFWMGVPVVTRVGETCVGRGGLSQLHQLDLLELAGKTDEGFVEAAVGLAGDVGRLGEMRRGLRRRMEGSALMDGRGFAREVEGAYRGIWREYVGEFAS